MFAAVEDRQAGLENVRGWIRVEQQQEILMAPVAETAGEVRLEAMHAGTHDGCHRACAAPSGLLIGPPSPLRPWFIRELRVAMKMLWPSPALGRERLAERCRVLSSCLSPAIKHYNILNGASHLSNNYSDHYSQAYPTR
jgi:hypothetical protein